MGVLFLSRLQFAVATAFHFLFVPLTLGLSILVAWMETRYVRTGEEDYLRMAKFWGKIFIINFALGVVTGITLEFQFGTNWAGYSKYVGDIFGSLLAVEATVAFFLESTFIGLWIWGWKRLSPKMHAACIWLVAIAGNVSAYWILVANSFMQHPVGYVLKGGRAELADFIAIITQKWAVVTYVHVLAAAFTLSGFFIMGISAYHLLRKNEVSLFSRSFRMGLGFALVFAIVAALSGHMGGTEVAAGQPTKLAAMESHWETEKGAGMYLLAWPDQAKQRNRFQFIKVPYVLSILAYANPGATVKGLKEFPRKDQPPVWLTFLSFRLMVGLGTLFILLTIWGWLIRKRLADSPGYLKLMLWAIPLPYLAIELGWMVTEVGRQPWIVWGLMRTSDAVSPLATHQVVVSLIAFIGVYGLLGAVAYWLIFRFAKAGPPAPETA